MNFASQRHNYAQKMQGAQVKNLCLVVRQGDSAGCLPEQELSVFFTQRRAHLKTSKRLPQPSFYGNKLVKFDDSLFYKLLTLYTKCI